VGGFCKAILKGVAGALGMSYNKISSDYESTSYSSLRQSNIEDEVAIKELQQFFIDNWKNIQFAEWLKYLLISDLTNLPYSKLDKFISH
jgi:capsid protein